MSLDDLRADLKANIKEAKGLSTVEALRDHFVNTLWPFVEAITEIVEEIDDTTAELVDRTEDYLQSDTAAIFAALVQSSSFLSAELRKRAAGDDILLKRLDAHDALCAQAIQTLGQITMIAPEPDAKDEDEDEDEAEGSDGNA